LALRVDHLRQVETRPLKKNAGKLALPGGELLN